MSGGGLATDLTIPSLHFTPTPSEPRAHCISEKTEVEGMILEGLSFILQSRAGPWLSPQSLAPDLSAPSKWIKKKKKDWLTANPLSRRENRGSQRRSFLLAK